MLRPLTTAALLPVLGAASVAWAQPAPQFAHPSSQQAVRPAPGPWSGAPRSGPLRSDPAGADRAYAPQSHGAPRSAGQTAWRPPVIPHGGYPWRAPDAQYAPAPDFRPVTSHPDATWRPYVEPIAPAAPPPGSTPWNHQPYVAPAPSAAPYSPPREVYEAPRPVPARPMPDPRAIAPQAVAPQPAPLPPVRRELTPSQTPPPMPEPLRPMPPPARVQSVPVQPAPVQPTPPQPKPVQPTPPRPQPTPPAPRSVAPVPEPAPTPAPQPAPQPQRAPVPVVEPAPQPSQPTAQTAPSDPAFDPMAPRRDAPIFQLQRAAPPPSVAAPTPAPAAPAQPSATPATAARAPVQPAPAQPAPQPALQASPADAPVQGSARYYSVHRQAGRQPDATPLPAPNYLDALPVELNDTPTSDDLAQPPEPPALMRDAQGRLRAAPMADDPLLP